MNPGELQEVTVDNRETVTVSAVLEGNVIQGTLTMGKGEQQVTHEFKAVRTS